MALPDNSPQTQPEPDVFSSKCSSRDVLQRLTGRWGVLVVVALSGGSAPLRFAEIRRKIDGVSDRMLTQTLRQLERDGIAARQVHGTIPPHVTYHLTELGAAMAGPLKELVTTLEAQLPAVLKAQQEFDDAAGSR